MIACVCVYVFACACACACACVISYADDEVDTGVRLPPE